MVRKVGRRDDLQGVTCPVIRSQLFDLCWFDFCCSICYAADSVREEILMQWTQIYDPLGHWWLSTLVAGLPIIVLFSLLAGLRVKPHWCAIAGAVTAVGGVNCLFQKPPPPAGIQFW